MICTLTSALLVAVTILPQQSEAIDKDPLDSGGALAPEQAAYDVEHYDLELEVFPAQKRIEGQLVVTANLSAPLDVLALDLDGRLRVTSTSLLGKNDSTPLTFEQGSGQVRIALGDTVPAGQRLRVSVRYGGEPRVAPNPPWDGGFTWAQTPTGEPWIATSCQTNGADLWWPCKDHPSDEPESFDLRVTVPGPLICAANGRLVATHQLEGDRTKFHWSVSTPINTYCVALNIAPYETITQRYRSTAGDEFPVTFWVLPQHVEEGKALMPDILAQLRWFEETFGPYPFRGDKYGIVETPHLGMEHQTIIAYGNRFKPDPWGFDWLHHHEIAHEWWGNLVSCADWRDFWIHEGFGTYCQQLYTEHRDGRDRYLQRMQSIRNSLRNRSPVAPRESRSTQQMMSNEVYYKGAWILHTLRFLVGDEAFFQSVRRLCYPDPDLEATTDGRACHHATTDGYRDLVEQISGRELNWFFELYLRQPALPMLISEQTGKRLSLAWETPGDLPFPMPVEVRQGDQTWRVEMPDGKATVELKSAAPAMADPDEWILQDRPRRRPRRNR